MRRVRRLLVVSNDLVGRSMVGPGIRAFELARRLVDRFDVTLAVPRPTDLGPPGMQTVVVPAADHAGLTRLACSGFDVVLAQRLPLPTALRLARTGVTRVYDLYAPMSIELLASLAAAPGRLPDHELVRDEELTTGVMLESGSAFLCANETQRDYWLGRLEAAGRLTPAAYENDPSLRSLIDVVPPGIPEDPPRPGRALKGVVDGISVDDRVILWNGGIWDWFDPLTVIRGVAELSRSRADVRLVFMGTAHPNPSVVQRTRADQARGLARELGLEGTVVHFNEGWVPYEERGAFLLDADLGVSAHADTFEARLAFRTRILDCLWAGLPVVVTEGDALATLVAQRGLGRTVAVEDPSAWAAALATLLDNPAAYSAAREAVADARSAYTWDRAVERLVPLLLATGSPLTVRGARRRLAEHLGLRARASLRHRGALGLLRRTAWHAQRAARRGVPGG